MLITFECFCSLYLRTKFWSSGRLVMQRQCIFSLLMQWLFCSLTAPLPTVSNNYLLTQNNIDFFRINDKHGVADPKFYETLLEHWFPSEGEPPQAFLVDTSELALLFPDWLKLRMISSKVDRLVDAGNDGQIIRN